MASFNFGRVARDVASVLIDVMRRGSSSGGTATKAPSRSRTSQPTASARRPAAPAATGKNGEYPGDFIGQVHPVYAPNPDGDPDPGEIVWTWVPYEDDPSRGKDRPVLLIGHDGAWLLGLMLTSKDHDRDAADEARWGRRWIDIGTGPWDSQGRDSEVRLDRVIRIDPEAVRREGAVLDKRTFDAVIAARTN